MHRPPRPGDDHASRTSPARPACRGPPSTAIPRRPRRADSTVGRLGAWPVLRRRCGPTSATSPTSTTLLERRSGGGPPPPRGPRGAPAGARGRGRAAAARSWPRSMPIVRRACSRPTCAGRLADRATAPGRRARRGRRPAGPDGPVATSAPRAAGTSTTRDQGAPPGPRPSSWPGSSSRRVSRMIGGRSPVGHGGGR